MFDQTATAFTVLFRFSNLYETDLLRPDSSLIYQLFIGGGNIRNDSNQAFYNVMAKETPIILFRKFS